MSGRAMSSLAFSQARVGRGDVALPVLRLPGEALAHRVPLDLVGEALEGEPLAGLPGALDELDDADAMPAGPSARSISPKAAVDLPLPGPVWTTSRPFSTVFEATSRSCTSLRFAILAR